MVSTAKTKSSQPVHRGRTTKFTPERIQRIRHLVERGMSREAIAEIIGVTTGSLMVTCSRLGISLRRRDDSTFVRTGLIAPTELAEAFGLSVTSLARTVGLAPETLQRTARARAPKTQERLREAIEIIRRVSDWAGGDIQAMAWYRAQPIPAFGGRTAEALVKEGRADAVRDYLDAVANGSFA